MYMYIYHMKNLIKQDIWAARRFNNTVRYIDDLLKLNNSRFEYAIDDIYPPELQLKKTTESPTSLSYLDTCIMITINNGKYSTAVYDRRDSFDLISHTCVQIFHLNQHMVYTYISQLVRMGRICSCFVQFKERHYKLTERLIHQGFWYAGLCMAFKKFARCHAGIFSKYSV